MEQCARQKTGVPQWYLVLDEAGAIAAGAGVIENDFHERKDLSPNHCALYVEKEHRKQRLAKQILDFTRKDFGAMGFQKLYLLTDHVDFYENAVGPFIRTCRTPGGKLSRMYVARLRFNACKPCRRACGARCACAPFVWQKSGSL